MTTKTKLTEEAINELAWYMIGFMDNGPAFEYKSILYRNASKQALSIDYPWYDVVRARRRIKKIMGDKK